MEADAQEGSIGETEVIWVRDIAERALSLDGDATRKACWVGLLGCEVYTCTFVPQIIPLGWVLVSKL